MPKISVIIPHHTKETEHHSLVSFLKKLKDPDLEILSVTAETRAKALNAGARKAANDYLWFVHADTKLTASHVAILKTSLESNPDNIHYFDLSYKKGMTSINAFGANIRSRLLGLPWGDQAFCLSRTTFVSLGTYNEQANYGEDHLLVWKAHQSGIKLQRLPLSVLSSTREYRKRGWLRLTLKRQYLWIKQALPEFIALIKKKLKSD